MKFPAITSTSSRSRMWAPWLRNCEAASTGQAKIVQWWRGLPESHYEAIVLLIISLRGAADALARSDAGAVRRRALAGEDRYRSGCRSGKSQLTKSRDDRQSRRHSGAE